MSSCCSQAVGTARFFSFFARAYRKRYLKKGLEPSQKELIEGLAQAGIAGASVLEIGCGVGYLHQYLLQQGASTATGIDLSEKMLAEARALALQQGLRPRVRYVQGDFTQCAEHVAGAGIVILDKVVCCYPDAQRLVGQALSKAQRAVALTYPRQRWFVRAGMQFMNALLWLLRSPFRGYVHEPNSIERWIAARGFSKVYENKTLAWLTQVYVRKIKSQS